VFAIACTQQGYVPTHNKAFSLPLTGDTQVDTLQNRTKRKFADRTGIRCGSHQQPVLLQTYTRDTGERDARPLGADHPQGTALGWFAVGLQATESSLEAGHCYDPGKEAVQPRCCFLADELIKIPIWLGC